MIDWIVDLVVGHWPVLATGFAGLAVGITVLRWVAPKTKSTLDDEIVAKADKIGLTAFLEKYNPFKRKK